MTEMTAAEKVCRSLATLLRVTDVVDAGLLGWGWAKVVGESMLPTLRSGDRLLVSYRADPHPGDIVVARLPDGTLSVKRANERRTGGWWLLSDNAEAGIDSRHRGAIPDADVLAVARLRIWPRPRLLRGTD
jgi:nickel-type superoxide dismutase maturation protease